MEFRIAHSSDYKNIAKIHKESFNGFFLTELGLRFLQLYYKSVLGSSETIAVCAINNDGTIVGFVTGCKNSIGYNKRLIIKYLLSYFFYTLFYLSYKPQKLYRLLKNFSKTAYEFDNGDYCELQSIAVQNEYKGLRIGEELVKKFENIALENNIIQIALTTDYYNNDSVVNFYLKNGYKIFYDFYTYPKRRMYKLIKDIL